MHFKILEIHFLEEKSGKNPAKFFETGPEPEPDIEAGYPAGTGFSRISGRFLLSVSKVNIVQYLIPNSERNGVSIKRHI